MRLLILASAGLALAWLGAAEWMIKPHHASWAGGVVWYCSLVSLAGCWLSGAVTYRVAKTRREALPTAIIAMAAARLRFAGMAIIVAAMLGPWPLQTLCVWMVVGYLLMLTIETLVTARWLAAGV